MESVPDNINGGNANEWPVSPMTKAGISIEPSPVPNKRGIDKGKHPTSLLTTCTINKLKHKQGYNSDSYLGTELNVLSNNGPHGYWKELLPEAEEASPDAAFVGISLDPKNTNVNTIEVTTNIYIFSDTNIDILQVVHLKGVCTLLEFSKKGNKSDLRSRLKQAREDKVEYLKADSINPAAITQREVLVNNSFPPSAK